MFFWKALLTTLSVARTTLTSPPVVRLLPVKVVVEVELALFVFRLLHKVCPLPLCATRIVNRAFWQVSRLSFFSKPNLMGCSSLTFRVQKSRVSSSRCAPNPMVWFMTQSGAARSRHLRPLL